MPSPFPGMDPYLEGDLWTTLHVQLCVEIARQLTPCIFPKYLAFANERQIADSPDDVTVEKAQLYPDVGIVKVGSAQPHGGGIAVAEAPHRGKTTLSMVPHSWVEIRDRAQRKLVTMIEVLSPTNKRGEGRTEYIQKRDAILHSDAHMLEIDLLRKGKRVPMDDPLPAGDYFVILTRANKRPESDIWASSLSEPLPTVAVPLLDPDPDVHLNLQQVFTTIYDFTHYELAIDYSRPPDVSLPNETLAWARERIKTVGIEPSF